MVIIDKSRVHRLEVQCCHYIEMFQHGFFPASFNRPKTAFTFRLWRMTLSMFPHLIPDQYRELMRVAQQWRQLKTMKWHGFGHCSNDPKAGNLALFCPACHQPGINISMSGAESFDETSSWKYTQSFVMDENFKAEHLHPIKPHDEVWLSDGLGFMVGKDRYKLHLAEASDMVENLSCNNHWAINQANVVWHKLESMGIGGVACARHDCFTC
ncbi:hypothetical protein BDR04DRAFT_1129570 [Suillus decipiens]|nr:hypothetical protein BDR04DRAFT_1129570 [Suillus decipiens]